MLDLDELVNNDGSEQSREIFWNQDLYQLEIERIFSRCWLFLTHESLIPKYGDFVSARMAEEEIIVCRQKDDTIRAFINSCTHRGNQVCHAESGNARAFICNYHGWAYGTDGALVDIPLEQRCHAQVNKEDCGLPQVRVESYRGFLYGCFDADAPSLEEYLGEFGWLLDTWMIGAGNGVELLGPPSKSVLDCNWKVPAENFVGDAYHVGWTHAAALEVMGGELAGLAGNRADMPFDDMGKQFTTRHGHGFGVINNAATSIHIDRADYDTFMAEQLPKVAENLGEARADLFNGHWNCTLFPNNSFLYGTNTFKVWHPRGPHQIEVWSWTLVHKDMDRELRKKIQIGAAFTFGTAGTLEADDGENMMTCTHSNRGSVTRRGTLKSTMGLNHEGPHPDYPGIVGASFIGETSYRGFYRFYKEILKAQSWDAVRDNDDSWDSTFENRDFWKNRPTAS